MEMGGTEVLRDKRDYGVMDFPRYSRVKGYVKDNEQEESW